MPLTEDEKRLALSIARTAISSALNGEDYKAVKIPEGSALQARLGLFVTLHKNHHLRGCIGNFTSELPLYENIIEMAHSAAFSDPRFTPLTLEELPNIHIEISVLSAMRKIKDVSEIEVGRHGIFIEKGYARGVLLPQVATENNFDRETFLEHTCMKAGLAPGCWTEDVNIFIFEADIFSEKV